MKNYAAAREQYVKLLEDDPQNPVFLYLFGVTLEAEDRPAEAINYYELALQIDPDFAEARTALERARAASSAVQLPNQGV